MPSPASRPRAVRAALVASIVAVTACAGGSASRIKEPSVASGTLTAPHGDTIDWSARGDGPPIVVLPGGPAPYAPLYSTALAPLEQSSKLVFWDYAGTGFSRSIKPPTMKGDREDLRAIVQWVAGGRAVLLAHGYGCMLALRFAVEHPTLVRALILIGPVRSFEEYPLIAERKRARLGPVDGDKYVTLQHSCFRAIGCGLPDEHEWLRLDVKTDVFDPTRVAAIAAQIPFAPYAGRDRFEEIDAYDVRPILPRIHTATLVIRGLYDSSSGDDPLRIQETIAGSKLEVFERSGHYPFLEEPERFMRAVEDFLATAK